MKVESTWSSDAPAGAMIFERVHKTQPQPWYVRITAQLFCRTVVLTTVCLLDIIKRLRG